MLPPPILSRPELRPTTRVARPTTSQRLRRAADELREHADTARRDAVLAAQADDETGLAAEALRLVAQRRRRLAADELAFAEECEVIADRLAREGR